MCCFDTKAEEAACICVKFFYMLTSLSRQVSNNFSLVYTHTHTHARTHAHTETPTHGMWKQPNSCLLHLAHDIRTSNTARGEMGLPEC
jgi:hypothetical protein